MISVSDGLFNIRCLAEIREEELSLLDFLVDFAGGQYSNSASGELTSKLGVSTSDASFLSLAQGDSMEAEHQGSINVIFSKCCHAT